MVFILLRLPLMLEVFTEAFWIVFAIAGIGFITSIVISRNDIADVLWGVYPAACAAHFLVFRDVAIMRWLVSALIIMWGVRLTLHIGSRNARKSEDPRYALWRLSWGKFFYLRSFLQVYVLQGLLSLCVMMPLIVVFSASDHDRIYSTALLALGVVMWIIGFFFESVGDYQLRQFLGNQSNKGRIMTDGLWRYTRHPNYFGEIVMWWALFFVVCGITGPSVILLFALVSPIVITILILCVSGIPMTEKRYEGDAAFALYKKRTNALFPGPVKESD